MIRIKRAYEPPARGDGRRVLVERLWPRGVAKAALALDDWCKDVAPSTELRQWFGHRPARWAGFQQRYGRELDAHPEAWAPLVQAAQRGTVTLVYGARDTEHNAAVALRNYLETHAADGRATAPGPGARPKRAGASRRGPGAAKR